MLQATANVAQTVSSPTRRSSLFLSGTSDVIGNGKKVSSAPLVSNMHIGFVVIRHVVSRGVRTHQDDVYRMVSCAVPSGSAAKVIAVILV